MKIRFIEAVTTDGTTYAAGAEHDLPAPQANGYIQSGLASKTEETRFARASTLQRPHDPVSTPPILAVMEATGGNLADPTRPLGSGNPPASRTTAVPALAEAPDPLPLPAPKARAPRN